jgi:hypothetical protein
MELIFDILTWFEQHLAWALLILLAAVNVLVLAVHLAGKYFRENGLPPGPFKDNVDKIIYKIDEACDKMDNPAKKAQAVMQMQQLLGWLRKFIPGVLVGWIIDAEVAFIRKVQRATDTPNVHQEEGQSNG